ncbi:TRAP transporter small permease [Telmatospirillum sp. J64-1]|uniref:TRAP transporter small permease n=1 Tax=Telmatospirillum sp. J64-1 TaxID=2502183 RepID=UPI00115DC82F|nr:TRAP transporter small permease subunit [Telmatospirillum sp. J64-1]
MLHRISAFLQSCAIACLFLMLFFILLQILARNVLALGLPWAEELARYFSVAMIFLAVPILLSDRAHVCVDFFVGALPASIRMMMHRICSAFVMLFCAIFLYSGWLFMGRAWKFSTPALGLPNWVFYAPVFLGIAMMGIVALREIFAPSRAPDIAEERQ